MSGVTFVSSLIECTDNPIQVSRLASYLDSASHLLNLDANFVVFVSNHLYAQLFNVVKRPVFFIPLNAVDLPAFRSIGSIIQSRIARQYYPDPRNTAQYFAVTCSKHWMVRESIRRNPFGSNRFFWIDLSIHRACAGIDQSIIDRISSWSGHRVRVGMLRSYPKAWVKNRAEFYQFGRPTLIGGLWGGEMSPVRAACELMIDVFTDLCEEGYGHADEQVMYEAFDRCPDLFDIFPSDYRTLTRNFNEVSFLDNLKYAIECSKICGRDEIVEKLKYECSVSSALSDKDKEFLTSL